VISQNGTDLKKHQQCQKLQAKILQHRASRAEPTEKPQDQVQKASAPKCFAKKAMASGATAWVAASADVLAAPRRTRFQTG